MSFVVKRKGHKEKFDEKKVYASVYAACISADRSEKQSEKIAEGITKKIEKLVLKKRNISSRDIRKFVAKELKSMDEELEFYYEQHLPNLKKL